MHMAWATKVVRRSDRFGRDCADQITLNREQRYRRRIAMRTDAGRDFLLDLPEATCLADGDALLLDTGELIEVRAATEPLLSIRAADAVTLARIAWHIGNRHTPCEITPTTIYIQPDHVLAEMVVGLGGEVRDAQRPFEPEGGAYGGKGPLARGHHHHGGDGHGHDHGHVHAHEAAHHQPTAAPRAQPKIWRPE